MCGYRADRAFGGERLLRDGALVLLEGSHITAVEAGSAAAAADCEVSYLPGTTLLPGLIDTHVTCAATTALARSTTSLRYLRRTSSASLPRVCSSSSRRVSRPYAIWAATNLR